LSFVLLQDTAKHLHLGTKIQNKALSFGENKWRSSGEMYKIKPLFLR